MRSIKFLLTFMIVIFLVSCSGPRNKKAYLEQYDEFIVEVRYKCFSYDETEWKEANEKYEKFNNEWYNKFKDEFSGSEKLQLLRYSLEFKAYNLSGSGYEYLNDFFESDYPVIKEQIQYYIENEMDDDIDSIVEFAKKNGKEALDKLKKVFKELNYNDIDLIGDDN